MGRVSLLPEGHKPIEERRGRQAIGTKRPRGADMLLIGVCVPPPPLLPAWPRVGHPWRPVPTPPAARNCPKDETPMLVDRDPRHKYSARLNQRRSNEH